MKTFFAYFFSFTLFIPTLISCVQDSDRDTVSSSSQHEKSVLAIFESIDKFETHSDLRKNAANFEFTQESVDFYAELMGYQAGDFSIEQVEELAAKLGVVSQEGVLSVLNDFGITQATQLLIEDILNGEPIDDLSNFPEYLTKSQNEQELLDLANVYVQAAIVQGRGCTFWGGLGAVLGGLIGGALCAPLCIILGGVVGGLLGCDLGGGKGSDDDPGQNL